MQLQKLAVSLFEVPTRPTRSHIDFVDKGVPLKHANLHLRHCYLGRTLTTLIVENCGSINILSEL
jgi:hypothetical protein